MYIVLWSGVASRDARSYGSNRIQSCLVRLVDMARVLLLVPTSVTPDTPFKDKTNKSSNNELLLHFIF